MRAAIYARVSTERQERQQTIDSQLAALRAWAEAQGHSLVEQHVFRDEGYTRIPQMDRPAAGAVRRFSVQLQPLTLSQAAES